MCQFVTQAILPAIPAHSRQQAQPGRRARNSNRHANNPESFRGSQFSIGADPTGVPEVNRPAVAGLLISDFHNPGALPQALM